MKSTNFGQLKKAESLKYFEQRICLNETMIWSLEEVVTSLESRSLFVSVV